MSAILETEIDPADVRRGLPSMSSAARWLNCTGSVAMTRGLVSKSGKDAKDGHLVHAARAGEIDLEDLAEDRPDLADLTERMKAIESRIIDDLGFTDADTAIIEERIWLHDDRGQAVASGCPDRIHLKGKSALIIDDKSGRKKLDPAPSNPQLIGYALLTQEEHGITDAYLAIAQPWRKREEQPIAHIDAEMLQWQRGVYLTGLADAAAIISPEQAIATPGALQPGPWCDYCEARGFCPGSIGAQSRFLELAGETAPALTLAGSYALLTAPQKLQLYDLAKHAEKTAKAALDLLKADVTADPEGIPGLSLKPGAKRTTVAVDKAVFEAIGVDLALPLIDQPDAFALLTALWSPSLTAMASVLTGGKASATSLPKAAKEVKERLIAEFGARVTTKQNAASLERI